MLIRFQYILFTNFRPVRVIRLLSKDTIEEGMYKIVQEKHNLEQKITNNEGDVIALY